MKIAIVGTGISGLVAAYLLHEDHDIAVFEANDYAGGHTRTVRVERADRAYDVDTGFIVFNEQNYPSFCRLLERLGVASQPSNMSFSVKCHRTGLEYCGSSLNSLFAQRRNLLRPSFWRLVKDILRFFREAPELLDTDDATLTLGEYLDRAGYSAAFIEQHILPMGAAIWSVPAARLREFPAVAFVRFFANHSLLQVTGRPTWRVIQGGSSTYVKPLIRGFDERIRLSTPVRSIRREPGQVLVQPAGGPAETFDHVVLATHSDQALAILQDASDEEREVLGAMPYQANDVLLHTDASVLPRRRRAWASWNYHIPAGERDAVFVTYHMNRLQSLDADVEFCLTLNPHGPVDSQRVIRRMVYHHPVFTREALAAQRRQMRLNRSERTSFCGAYWGYGFHEDGVRSALAVCERFGKTL